MSLLCVRYPAGSQNYLLNECYKVGGVIAFGTMTKLGIENYFM